MSIKVNAKAFEQQAARLASLRRWSGAQGFWAAQAKGVIRSVVVLHPPSQGHADLASKKRGEGAVEGDIRKLFVGVSPNRAKHTDLASLHSRHRNPRGRVRYRRGYRVPRAALTSYIAEKKRHVGYLAAGFNAAAERTGYRPPAWIARHNAPGSVSMRLSDRRIHFRATNSVAYAKGVAGLTGRIQRGVDSQSMRIRREVEFLLIREARKAGFHT